MYMNLKPNQHKRISFNTTNMTSLWFIGPPLNLAPPPNLIFCSGPPPNYFGLKFLGPPLKLRGGAAAMRIVERFTKRLKTQDPRKLGNINLKNG